MLICHHRCGTAICVYLKKLVTLRYLLVFVVFKFFLKYFLMYLCVVVLIELCNACIDVISFFLGALVFV